MEHNQAEHAELLHLEQTIAVAAAQWDALASRSRKRAEEIQAAQDEMLERVTYDMGGLSSAQGFLDLMELSQSADPVGLEAQAQRDDDQAMLGLARMMKSPYFARIDFRLNGEDEARQIYIGRTLLMDRETLTIHVYDWRTPVASLYYRHGVGPASYEAPGGTMSGEMTLKRQFEIRDGKLLFYFDADVEVMDEFLRQMLSRSASPTMKSIVETIQRGQDAVIRDMDHDLLMVQGVAGSGKTSVALHRVAYLMYSGLNERRLTAQDILILSPNAVFERYISQVLPELGENQVRTALFEELLEAVLPGARVQSRGAWTEEWLACRGEDEKARMRGARAFKGSRAFMALLDRFAHELPRRWIPFADVDYAGQCVAWGDAMRTAVCNNTKNVPLEARLRSLERGIFERVHALRPARMERLLAFVAQQPQCGLATREYARMLSIADAAKLLGQIRAFTRVDCQALYRALFADPTAFARLSQGLLPPEEVEAIRCSTHGALAGDSLPYGDAAAIAYLQARVQGVSAYASVRQVVLDEAQDADCLHVALLGLLFPRARFTILGDMYQTIAAPAAHTLYEDIAEILRRPSHMLATLNKSFRCTREIWAFGASFLPPDAAGECFGRSGEPPRVLGAPDPQALVALIAAEAQACRAAGCQSVALLCKTEEGSRSLYDRLKDRLDLRLIREDSAGQTQGIFVIPLYVAKGLEFDAVLVCDADEAHYRDAEDQKLLYIACTRALHRLRLCYAGRPSPLLPGEKEGE